MKKSFIFAMACIVASLCLFTACGESNTPSGTAETSMKALKKGDYKAMVETFYIKGDSNDEKKANATMLEGLMKEKVGKEMEKKGGLSSYTIVNEQIDESGEKATVEIESVYGDGSKDTQTMKLVKVDGKWYNDLGK